MITISHLDNSLRQFNYFCRVTIIMGQTVHWRSTNVLSERFSLHQMETNSSSRNQIRYKN